MGVTVSSFWKSFNQREKIIHLAMVGLDGSGKTTIFHKLKGTSMTSYIATSTVGYNVDTIRIKNHQFQLYDIGGCTAWRPVWRHFLNNLHAIVFVVDASDLQRLAESEEELKLLMNEDQLEHVKFLIFANKSDLSGALSAGNLAAELGLFDELADRLSKTSRGPSTVTDMANFHHVETPPHLMKISPMKRLAERGHEKKSKERRSFISKSLSREGLTSDCGSTADLKSSSSLSDLELSSINPRNLTKYSKSRSCSVTSLSTSGSTDEEGRAKNKRKNPLVSCPIAFPAPYQNRWFVQASIATTGEGLIDGFSWIAESLSFKLQNTQQRFKKSKSFYQKQQSKPILRSQSSMTCRSSRQVAESNSLYSDRLSILLPKRPMTPSPSLLRLESSQQSLPQSVSLPILTSRITLDTDANRISVKSSFQDLNR